MKFRQFKITTLSKRWRSHTRYSRGTILYAVMPYKQTINIWAITKDYKLCALLNDCYKCSGGSCGEYFALKDIEESGN